MGMPAMMVGMRSRACKDAGREWHRTFATRNLCHLKPGEQLAWRRGWLDMVALRTRLNCITVSRTRFRRSRSSA